MNNEEKILSALENLTTKVDGLSETVGGLTRTVDGLTTKVDVLAGKVDVLEQGQSELRQGLAVVERDLQDVRQAQTFSDIKIRELDRQQAEMTSTMRRIEQTVARIENDHGLQLKALNDGFQANLDMHKALEPRIVVLERISEKHSAEIYALRTAK